MRGPGNEARCDGFGSSEAPVRAVEYKSAHDPEAVGRLSPKQPFNCAVHRSNGKMSPAGPVGEDVARWRWIDDEDDVREGRRSLMRE